jgi:hypothetical protein
MSSIEPAMRGHSMLFEMQIHCAAESHDYPPFYPSAGHAAICTSIIVGQVGTHVYG